MLIPKPAKFATPIAVTIALIAGGIAAPAQAQTTSADLSSDTVSANGPSSQASSKVASIEPNAVRAESIYIYTNGVRVVNGRKPVRKSPALNHLSQDWANHLAQDGELQHRPNHWEYYPSSIPAGGENVLQAWDDYSNAQLVKLWADSPGHRKILLDPDAKSVGIGVAKDKDGKLFAVQNFGR